jgi:pimeloyl-ACP methyl ester carboxylesterase
MKIYRHYFCIVFIALKFSIANANPIADLFSLKGDNEQTINLTYKEKNLYGLTDYKLEAIVYMPRESNGKLVLWSHGSVSNPNQIKITHRLLPIANEFTNRGYTFVIWMRTGRGNSEGTTEEYSGDDCNIFKTDSSLIRNRDQMSQVINQVKDRYSLSKVFLIGHSRGGMISANYASHNSNDISAVINLAGAYNQFCDDKNGRHSYKIVQDSARFKNQRWIYYKSDTFFPDAYKNFIRTIATENNLEYYEPEGNHATPLLGPRWIPGALKWFDSL